MMLSALVLAALPSQWSAWKWSASVAPSRAVMQRVTLSPEIVGRAQGDLRDVRIIDARGDEVPYAVEINAGSDTIVWSEAHLDDYGFVDAAYTQVVARVPTPEKNYTSIDLSTPRSNFATTVDVFASDDHRHWRLLRSGAPIFDYQADGLGSNTAIRIPPSDSRFYRIVVRDARTAFPIDGVRFAQGAAAPPELERYAHLRATRTQQGAATVIVVDGGAAHLPVSLLRVDTTTSRFSRSVTVEASDDGSIWSTVDGDQLERTPVSQHLALSFDEAQARFWRVTIGNGNDQQLASVRVDLWGVPRHLVFARTGYPGYRVLFGNPAAQAPVYDFARVNRASALAAAAQVRLGQPQADAAYVAPQRPWSESHGWVIWAALGVAVVGIGGLALRLLMSEGSEAA